MGEGSILLIGNPSVAFTDVKSPDKLPVQVCARLSDGIQATVRQRFAAIAVVMAETGVNLRAGLEKLRKSTDARVVLLARMYEEPLAMELVGSACNGTGLADDYVICPVRMDTFCEVVRGRPKTVGHPQSVIASTAIEARMRQLEKLATEDDLTGLKNRRYVREFARQIIERAKKDNGRVTVLVFDIDDLKHYNDVYGHAAGDEVLKRAAVLIRRCCRRHDVVGRMGGDEFAVVFWDDPRCAPPPAGSERRTFAAEHPKEAILIAKRFRHELEKAKLKLPGLEGSGVLTISGGLSSLGKDGLTAEELFEKADQALLDAKRSGKNRVYLVGSTHSTNSPDYGVRGQAGQASPPQVGWPENDIDKIE